MTLSLFSKKRLLHIQIGCVSDGRVFDVFVFDLG
jgi:hypothetical protein